MSARGITVVGASAGSGKTYRLTQEVVGAIDPRKDADALPLDSLVAVTYTRKAHHELASRIRQKLVGAGAFDEAFRLPLAYIGTVHAACLRLLQEFAIDAGLSPNVDVIGDDAGRLLRQAIESGLPHELRAELDRLGAKLKIEWYAQDARFDWLTPVSDMMELARSNRIAPDRLPAMAERSIEGLLKVLPLAERDGDALEDDLKEVLDVAVAAIDRNEVDTTKATKAVRASMARMRKLLASGDPVNWDEWVSLTKLDPGVKSTDIVEPVKECARRVLAHPVLHDDLRAMTRAMFEAARHGLTAYQEWKGRRHVVDYVDLLDRTFELVMDPRVAEVLAERLRLIVVDEFQDTSPLQLALFVRLNEIARRSMWVGDRKQCIFEYAGADPRLMDDVARWVARTGGQEEQLQQNWRSRPELVEFCSELFAAALARHEFARGEVVVEPTRKPLPEHATFPPLGLWTYQKAQKEREATAFADGIERMLRTPEATPVLDRTTNEVRPVRPGDIAVIVATNREATALAEALHERGIRSAVARPGLLATPEGVLVDAALRWLLDRQDTLAAARLDALNAFDGRTPDDWLDDLLLTGELVTAWRAALAPVRERLRNLSPCEAVDEVLRALDVTRMCLRWPDSSQRIANLDALRGLVGKYEKLCEQEREAGTVAGLLRFFEDLSAEHLKRDELIASDDQHVPSDDGAVVITTYHRSKGLEWPVVILGSLDRKPRNTPFSVCPESDRQTFNATDPLAGRWIRYWPVGSLEGCEDLEKKAAESPEGEAVAAREDKERARLLYVGFTRARDHLVLVTRTTTEKGKKGAPDVTTAQCQWLNGLHAGAPLLGLPLAAADGEVASISVGGQHPCATRVWRVSCEKPTRERAEPSHAAFAPVSGARAEALAHKILPSAATAWAGSVMPKVTKVVLLPGQLSVVGATDAERNKIGDAVHGFFAADLPGLSVEARKGRAARLLALHGVAARIDVSELLEASDRLRDFVAERWPRAVWHREVALGAMVGAGARQALGGTMDLLLEIDGGYVLFDHKTFQGRDEASWRAKAESVLPQFVAYTQGLGELGAKRVLEAWVHLPVGGAMVRIKDEGSV